MTLPILLIAICVFVFLKFPLTIITGLIGFFIAKYSGFFIGVAVGIFISVYAEELADIFF